jgi:hypothetical protein
MELRIYQGKEIGKGEKGIDGSLICIYILASE